MHIKACGYHAVNSGISSHNYSSQNIFLCSKNNVFKLYSIKYVELEFIVPGEGNHDAIKHMHGIPNCHRLF